ncbi:MAG: hypothetical protein M0R46_06475 [Candidatus Muirbacterium halophilum]|nr:hypothetical protein [Candidatus Muirbacterium halophilum]
MPNSSILGGSPLGLINLRSYTDINGRSTFNAGESRNVDVKSYNNNKSNVGLKYGNSLFTGARSVVAWPKINDVDSNSKEHDLNKDHLHNDSVYDTSILNIIEKLSNTKAQLRPSDFAYLKNVGVYPNNRLMIARRFATPVGDNIMTNKKDADLISLATLISWLPEGQDFLSISFGEVWEEAPADFKNILTSLGEDMGIGNLGGIAGAAGNLLPLPGFTEIFQRNFLASLGLIEKDVANMIPSGNPNLIKQAKMRKTVGYSSADSGLKCNVNIKMTCEYELKYISGIDPTIVWMDLLGMITRFGTSESTSYGLGLSASSTISRWLNNPNDMIGEMTTAIYDAIYNASIGIKEELEKSLFQSKSAELTASSSLKKQEGENNKKAHLMGEEESILNAEKMGAGIRTLIKDIGTYAINGLVQKYRVKIIGVLNTLTGMPSTPWHITIGNPLRPTFCSGDMLVDNVELKLGPTLAFNDLPSNITVDFSLTNARPWGMQEIMRKFNSGYLRTIKSQKSYYETNSYMIGEGKDARLAIESPGQIEGYDYSAPVSGTQSVNITNQSTTNNIDTAKGSESIINTNGDTSKSNLTKVTKAIDGKLPNEGEMNKDANSPVKK